MTTPTLSIPSMHAVRIVLFDMDGTIVEAGPDVASNPFLTTLCRLMCDGGRARDEEDAMSKVAARVDMEQEDLLPHLEALGVEPAPLIEGVAALLRPHVSPFPDAVKAVRALHEAGYELVPATTNSTLACLAKLVLADLATCEGSPYFAELFGGTQVVPKGKSSPAFYTALLERIGAEPDEVVMVGDDVTADLRYAREAGIRHVVVPRRTQAEPWVIEQGGIFVRSLESLVEWLPPRANGREA